MTIKEFFICYWGAALDAPLCLLNVVLFIATGNLVNLAAVVFIGVLFALCVAMGNGTRRSRESIRESETWLRAYYERHGL